MARNSNSFGKLNVPNLKQHQPDKQSLQSWAYVPLCASLKARYLNFSGGLRHCGSCWAIHVTLIALEHFQISLKNNTLCAEPWGLWGFRNRESHEARLSAVRCYLVTKPSRPFPHNQILNLSLVWPCALKLCYCLMTLYVEKDNSLHHCIRFCFELHITLYLIEQ